jgi:hypothetical protein
MKKIFENTIYFICVALLITVPLYFLKVNSSQISSSSITAFILNPDWLSPRYSYDFLFNFLSQDNLFNNNTLQSKKLLTTAFLTIIYSTIGLLLTHPIDLIINKVLKKSEKSERIIGMLFIYPLAFGLFFLIGGVFVYFPFSFIGNLI